MCWLEFSWLQMTKIQCKQLCYKDLGLSVSLTLRAGMEPGLRHNEDSRDLRAVRTLSFSDPCFILCLCLLSVDWLPGLQLTGQDTWAHVCNSWVLCPIISPATKRQIPSSPLPELLGRKRIVVAVVRCPPWTNPLRPGASYTVHNGSSVVTVYVCV